MPEIIIKEDKKFNWQITAKKFLVIAGMSAGLAATQALIESLSSLQMPVNSLETILVGLGIATLKSIENYLKNK